MKAGTPMMTYADLVTWVGKLEARVEALERERRPASRWQSDPHPGTKVERIVSILREARKPMHIDELVAKLGLKANQLNRMQTRAAMQHHLKQGRLIRLVGRSTFEAVRPDESAG